MTKTETVLVIEPPTTEPPSIDALLAEAPELTEDWLRDLHRSTGDDR